MDLKSEVLVVAEKYTQTELAKSGLKGRDRVIAEKALRAGIISGVTLTCRFLSTYDGSKEVTPQLLEKAALKAARELGLTPTVVPEGQPGGNLKMSPAT